MGKFHTFGIALLMLFLRVVNGINRTINATNSSNTFKSATGGPNALFFISFLVYATVFVVGLLGNLLVLVVFGIRCQRLKTCERYLVNLAVADLIGSLVVPADKLYYLLGGHYDVIGSSGCVCVSFVTITTFTVSSLTLVAISIDRYAVVKWPLRPRATKKVTLSIFAVIWTLGCLPGVPYLIKNHVHLMTAQGTDRMICGHNMKKTVHVIHTLITFAMQVALPLLVMTVTYILIIYELIQVENSDLYKSQQLEICKRCKQNKKTIKLLIVVVTVFFICVAPVNIFYLLYLFNTHSLSLPTATLTFNILLMLQMLNSCINPLIYSKLHTSFRRDSLKLLCSCCLHKFKSLQTEASRRMSYASSRLSRLSLEVSSVNERFMRRFSRVYSIRDSALAVEQYSSDPEFMNFVRELGIPIVSTNYSQFALINDVIHEEKEELSVEQGEENETKC